MATPYDLRKADLKAQAVRRAEQEKRNEEATKAADLRTAESNRRRAMPTDERLALEHQERLDRLAAHEKAQSGPRTNKALAGPPENKTATPSLDGLDFASDEAAELAAELSVTAAQLPKKPSGKNGYTVADVRKAAGE